MSNGKYIFSAGFIGSIRNRLAKRPDSEHEQAILRFFVGFVLTAYFAFLVSQGNESADVASAVVNFSVLFFLFAIVLLLAIIVKPTKSPLRRLVGMLGDNFTASYVLLIGGEAATPVIAVYLWITMGNGFRYGVKYLFACTVLNIIGFCSVYLLSEFWSQHPLFVASLLLVLMVLPLYVSTLLKKLNKAIDSANQANAAKSQFLANMSHELRTPLNGVIGISDLLVDTELNKDQSELARTIQSSAHTLLDLIENILDISTIEAGKVSTQVNDFDLHSLIKKVELMFEPQAQKKEVVLAAHISPATPFMLRGDDSLLRQVLINLMGNAIKFTHEGFVEVKVYPVSSLPNNLKIRFEISDSGIGIPEDIQDKIFESFTQADESTTRNYGGSGLGTAIAKQIVELMGGQIGLWSKPGVGTSFWFELPFEEQSSAEIDKQAHITLTNTKVLVMANPSLADMIQHDLDSWDVGADVVDTTSILISSLSQASEKAKPYHIAFIEKQTLDMEPEQFSRILMSNRSLNQLSVVLIDSYVSDEEEQKLLRMGFSSILSLPVDKSLLFNALHAAHIEHEPAENVVSLAEHFKQRSSAQLRILVAEDNLVNQKVIEGILDRAGHEAVLVNDGDSALDILEDESFDMLILDMNMPGLGGLDVLKAYRFMDTESTVPVIILTADATPSALQACEEAGANRYLTKPVDARHLLEIIAELAPSNVRAPSTSLPLGYTNDVNEHETKGEVGVLDTQVIDNLSQLGSGAEFIKDLLDNFTNDGRHMVEAIQDAVVAKDYPRYRDAIHALKGTAGDLGGVALMQLCIEAERLKPYEMNSARMSAIMRKIQQTLDETCVALIEYVEKQLDAVK